MLDLTPSSNKVGSSLPPRGRRRRRALDPALPPRRSSVAVAPLSSIRPSPQVVIADLGCVEVACALVRLVKKLRPSETTSEFARPVTDRQTSSWRASATKKGGGKQSSSDHERPCSHSLVRGLPDAMLDALSDDRPWLP